MKRRFPFICLAAASVIPLVSACTDGGSIQASGNGCAAGTGTVAGSVVDYQVVAVGDPGNAADTTSFGSVAYRFSIGKYNVSIGQYTAFLNAVARTDTYGLYHPSMGTDLNIAGITRSGAAGSYLYTAMNNGGDSSNRPISYVTWFCAARFANWMANGQPVGAQTSGTTEDGAYALHGIVRGFAVAKNTCNPNTGQTITFWLPTESEWYKAAYFSANHNNSGQPGYYLFATQSSATPGNVIGASPNQLNVIVNLNFSVTQNPTLLSSQNYLTDGGAYSGSASYYGTFDQNGPLYQWNDLDGTPFPYRGIRGSFWFAGTQAAEAINFAAVTPEHAGNDVGFRLASIAR